MNTTPIQDGVRNLTAAFVLTATLALVEQPAVAGSSLESFVLAVGGESTYPTFGVPQPVYNNFGVVGLSLPSNPAGLAASNIEGDHQHTTQPASPLLATFSFKSGNWVSTWSGSNRYTGAGAANARYGHITATAGGTYDGPGRDGFTITSTSINGQGTFDTVYLPFTFGVPVDFKIGLLSYNTPAKFITGNVKFALQITGITVFGVTDFVITSGSGTAYTTNGVQTLVSATPKIISAGFHAGGFRTLVTGLDPTKTYTLKRSDNLGGNFTTTIDGPRYPTNNLTPDTDYFTDPAPAGSRGFYRIQWEP